METIDIEQRFAAIETEIDRIKKVVENGQKQEAPWWMKISGTFKGDEDFDDAMRLGREYRESQGFAEPDVEGQ